MCFYTEDCMIETTQKALIIKASIYRPSIFTK